MAEKKKTAAGKHAPGKNNAKMNTAARKQAEPSRNAQTTVFDSPHSKTIISIISYGIGVCALLLLVLFIADLAGSNAWFTVICRFLYGMLSLPALCIPLLMIYCAIFLPKILVKKSHLWNLVLAVWFCLTLSVAAGLVKGIPEDLSITAVFKAGMRCSGGGIVGSYIAWLLIKALSSAGAWLLTIALMIAQVIFLVGLTLEDAGAFLVRLVKALFEGFLEKIGKRKEGGAQKSKRTRRLEVEEAEEEDEDEEFIPPPAPKKGTKYYNKPHQDENPYAEQEEPAKQEQNLPSFGEEHTNMPSEQIAPLPEPEIVKRPRKPEGWGKGEQSELAPKIKTKSEAVAGSVDLDEIFSDKKGKRDKRAMAYGQNNTDAQLQSAPLIECINEEEEEEEEEQEMVNPNSSEELSVKRSQLISTVTPGEEPTEEEEVKSYLFPPVSLLHALPPEHSGDVREELATNAQRLVETLRSFKVRTKVLDISRGPTITRYELQPEEGVRVRAIANLVDDISLNLATSGVRIEAPIPGKAAVGVEVPNKTRETVYLRTLIDDKRFESSSAKLTAAIGVDVGGEPIYVDLAKMPHLLIAGTTGSGKSVCLNCLILSILYKASPDEVKLIMIDPKKVEFNIYNGLPHLIIPVVSNAKKSAGALSWAVSEMERRYELIEAVGVRDIKNYNKITKNDPDKEFMPQLVIVIDELADLMMTAPGEVEESICRIAQKGRACGMHLIIGTQRPSVDVITGLIKANVPSRVAFTVSSQVDSRTIIDIAGAEKLIGRGDMLFAPVGAVKPVRLQGAFVSDEEVEAVTGFIINNSAEAVYDDKVMKDIEKEAALCGTKKKSSGVDLPAESEADGEGDPMFRAAVDLAVESGKISTSLIQRRLSLGYGRAAKLIDEMEKRGIVSPPEGQKPRSVLISAAQWHEICMRQSDLDDAE